MQPNIIYVFIDMDGTLARFHEHANWIEAMCENGFFYNLRPYEQMVLAVQEIIPHPNIQVIFHSSAPTENPNAIKEKEQWLEKHFPRTQDYDKIIRFLPCNKAEEAIKYLNRPLTEYDFLWDDYSANLRDWVAHGGTGIKCVNEIQDLPDASSWSGYRVGAENPWYEIVDKLQHILNIEIF